MIYESDMLNCADSHHFPALDLRKGDGVFMCPIQNTAVLLGSHDLKMSGVTTFWKSPYNGVVKMNPSGAYKHKALSISSKQSDNSKPLGLVKSILKNSRPRDSESDSSSTDETKKLRGILTKRGDSADTKKRTRKRVKFDDKLVRLHEIGRRYAPPQSADSGSADESEDKPQFLDSTRVLREINGNRMLNEREDGITCAPRVSSAQNNPCFKPAIELNIGGVQCNLHAQARHVHGSGNPRVQFEREFRTSSARLGSENIKVSDYERNISRERGHPRLCRAYTSPMLYSQKLPRKSGQNVIIYRQELCLSDDRNSNRSVKSAGSGSRQRVVFQAPSVLSDRSDASPGGLSRTNFCNDDKTTQIVRWLRNVNDTQAKEGRCPVLLAMSPHNLRES